MSLNGFFLYFGSKSQLAHRYCRERQGQVVVCEETGADWLPFRHLLTMRSVGKNMTGEVIWTNDATQAQATA